MNIDTIVPDIYALFGSGKEPNQNDLDELGKAMAMHISNAFKTRENLRALRGSLMGTKCDRKLWYTVNAEEDGEDLEPHTMFKFLYGHLLEELVLFLAQEAGHKVEKRQAEVDVAGVKGHIDGVIDGVLTDVKTANSRGMAKFKNNGLLEDDPFGYLPQIDFYREGLKDDACVTTRDTVAFLAIDKELGHLRLDKYNRGHVPLGRVRQETVDRIAAVSKPTVPNRGYFPVPDGKSGNLMLDTQCRYCQFKQECWPGLRTFAYASGPRWLTTVIREPKDVPEIFDK